MTMLKRSIQATLATILLALAFASTVSAHAVLIRTDPADGSTLNTIPTQLRLWFSEEVLLNLSTFELTDSHGQHIALTHFHLDDQSSSAIVIDLPTLKPDAYRLIWKTASSDDLHTSSGSIVFGVQQAAELAAPAPSAPLPQPGEVALRWLNFAALTALLGALMVAFILLASTLGSSSADNPQMLMLIERLRRRLLRLAVGAALAIMLISSALLVAQTASAGGISNLPQVISATNYGSSWLMREGWLAVLILVLVWRGRLATENDRSTIFIVTPLLLALLTVQSLSSHAAAFTDVSPWRIGADVLHLLGASVWAGGLLAMTITIAPLLRCGPAEKALARSILQRFGILAAASLAVLAVTGLYSTGQQVASLDALLTTSYGQSLVLKTGLVLAVGLIGLINSSLLHPQVADVIRRVLRRPIGWTLLDRQQLGRTIGLEAIGAASLLLVAGFLTASQPARGPEFDPPAAVTVPAALNTPVNDLMLTLSVKPDRPGQNFISLAVFNTRRPAPAPIERVTVRLTPPDGQRQPIELEAARQSDGIYQVGGSTIDMVGDWRMVVNVKRNGLPDVTLTTPWTVLPALTAASARTVLISNQPLAPVLTLAAGVLALVFAGLLGGFWLMRHRRMPAPARRTSQNEAPTQLSRSITKG
jgi:copper transport protein